jgi:hypothetical protein
MPAHELLLLIGKQPSELRRVKAYAEDAVSGCLEDALVRHHPPLGIALAVVAGLLRSGKWQGCDRQTRHTETAGRWLVWHARRATYPTTSLTAHGDGACDSLSISASSSGVRSNHSPALRVAAKRLWQAASWGCPPYAEVFLARQVRLARGSQRPPGVPLMAPGCARSVGQLSH